MSTIQHSDGAGDRRPVRNRKDGGIRRLDALADVRPGEGRCTLLLSAYAFVLLVCYYVLKTLREPLLLGSAPPEVKSYAYAAAAAALLVLVPCYGAVFRRRSRTSVGRWLTAFFVATLLGFVAAGRAGLEIGFAYYVWVGVFGVTILAQFWAQAADCLTKDSGERLFPAIMAAAAFGGLAGPLVAGQLFAALGPWPLMLLAAALLAATLPLIEGCRAAVPPESRRAPEPPQPAARARSGFACVLRDRYLLLLAAVMVLLNCVNTMGEYLLTELAVGLAAEAAAGDPAVDQTAWIASFYGNYFLAINALTVAAQLLLVSRLLRRLGATGALCVLPVIAVVGYGLLAFVPVFALLGFVKLLENGTDYSIMNTSRQLLYLPLPAAEKYNGKIAIDTFFYRVGDLLQAGIVFVGLNVLALDVVDFATINCMLAVCWLGVSLELARRREGRGLDAASAAPTRMPLERWRLCALGIYRSIFETYRNLATLLVTAALSLLALTASAPAEAGASQRQRQPSGPADPPAARLAVAVSRGAVSRGMRRSGGVPPPAAGDAGSAAAGAGTDRLLRPANRAKQGSHEATIRDIRGGARRGRGAARGPWPWAEPRSAAAPRERDADRLLVLYARDRDLERRYAGCVGCAGRVRSVVLRHQRRRRHGRGR